MRVTISKETTYITEPLRPDGYPGLSGRLESAVQPRCDVGEQSGGVVLAGGWAECYQRRTSQKVSPDVRHPAAAGKRRLFCFLRRILKIHLDRRCKQAAAAGEQFDEDLQERLWTQLETTRKRPWSREEFPVWAAWFTANEKPLSLLVEATKRPRQYNPLLSENSGMVLGAYFYFWGLPCLHDVAPTLVTRAMLRLNEGRAEAAGEDRLACHQVARLVDQGPMLVETLVAMVIESMAQVGD